MNRLMRGCLCVGQPENTRPLFRKGGKGLINTRCSGRAGRRDQYAYWSEGLIVLRLLVGMEGCVADPNGHYPDTIFKKQKANHQENLDPDSI